MAEPRKDDHPMAGGLAMIMTAAAGLLLQAGYDRDQVRGFLELGFEAYDRGQAGDQRMGDAMDLLTEFGEDVRRDTPYLP